MVGGNGGDGCLSFLSLPQKEFAGPDGGDGGNGGHVVFRGITNYADKHTLPIYVFTPIFTDMPCPFFGTPIFMGISCLCQFYTLLFFLLFQLLQTSVIYLVSPQ